MEQQKRTCFVICPLGKSESEDRERSNKLFDYIVKPVLEPMEYSVFRADLVHDHRTLVDSIIANIQDADLVVADLSTLNANVLYELGRRHAWGGRTVHIASSDFDLGLLPFDVRHYRFLTYDLTDPEKMNDARLALSREARSLERAPRSLPFEVTSDALIELTGQTLLLSRRDGRKDHYTLAEEMLARNCARIFLLQRSSTFVLGPESGLAPEQNFYEILIRRVADGVELFHLVSVDGIHRHIGRADSDFPKVGEALARLSKETSTVGIAGPNNLWPFKKLPDDQMDYTRDRQARALIVEFREGLPEALVAVDLGGPQSILHLKGPLVADYFRACVDFYYRCPPLKWADLEQLSTNQIILDRATRR